MLRHKCHMGQEVDLHAQPLEAHVSVYILYDCMSSGNVVSL